MICCQNHQLLSKFRIFYHILIFSGILYNPEDVCPIRFFEELRFWGMCNIVADKATILQIPEEQSIRQWLWNMTENPNSGIAAKVFTFLSASFVLISVAGKQSYK